MLFVEAGFSFSPNYKIKNSGTVTRKKYIQVLDRNK